MQHSFDLPETVPANLVQEYLHLTRKVMPKLAQSSKQHWPVRNDHCFQRIVLDTICGGVWYDQIARPAYRHLNQVQVRAAVLLCKEIISDQTDLATLNRQSLNWRGKAIRL
ncbi:MAG: hypothetical protein ACI8TF_001980 [Paracoccaceae bacterium]|jgi:hypothetical protein